MDVERKPLHLIEALENVNSIDAFKVNGSMLHHNSCISMQEFFVYTPASANFPYENRRCVNDVNGLNIIWPQFKKTSIFSMTSRLVSIMPSHFIQTQEISRQIRQPSDWLT